MPTQATTARKVAGRRCGASLTKRKRAAQQRAPRPAASPMHILHQVLVNRTLSCVPEEEPEPPRTVPVKTPPRHPRQARSKPRGQKATVRQRRGPRFQPRAHGANH